MKGFLVKCFLFLLIFIILEKLLIFLRDRLPEKEVDQRLEYILNGKIDANIIILGSSRGARSIVASQLASTLHSTAYNLSYPGSNVNFHEYLLTELLKYGNKKPSLLILAVDNPAELEETPSIRFRFDRLYPLVKYPEIRNTLIEKGEKNKILSELFVIHQLSISNFNLGKKHFRDKDTLLSDGSMPISWQGPEFNKIYSKEYTTYNRKNEKQDKLASFNSIIQICMANNITLLFAFAPNFAKPCIGFQNRIAELAGGSNNMIFYDTTNSVYSNPDYFSDAAHLKLNGATIFTNEIAEFINRKKILH